MVINSSFPKQIICRS